MWLFLFLVAHMQWAVHAALVYNHPRITPAPQLPANRHAFRRQQSGNLALTANSGSAYDAITGNNQFVGWYDAGHGDYTAWLCDTGYTWTTSASYGVCCPVQYQCTYTKCNGGNVVFGTSTASYGCGDSSYTCSYMTIFASASQSNPISYGECWNTARTIWSMTRDVRTTSATPSPSTSQSAAPSVTPSAAPISSAAPIPTTSPSSSSSSKAWIAGPVIGGLAGVALLAALGFWLYRRGQKSSKHHIPPQYYSAAPMSDDSRKSWGGTERRGYLSPQATPYGAPPRSIDDDLPELVDTPVERDRAVSTS